jgi:hypothetical protein
VFAACVRFDDDPVFGRMKSVWPPPLRDQYRIHERLKDSFMGCTEHARDFEDAACLFGGYGSVHEVSPIVDECLADESPVDEDWSRLKLLRPPVTDSAYHGVEREVRESTGGDRGRCPWSGMNLLLSMVN